MKRPIVALALVVTALFASAALAGQETLKVRDAFVLNGAALAPGDYRVELGSSPDVVKLMLGRQVVASAPCKLSPVGRSVRGNEIHTRPDAQGRGEIVRLVLADSGLSIDILPESEAALPPSESAGARR